MLFIAILLFIYFLFVYPFYEAELRRQNLLAQILSEFVFICCLYFTGSDNLFIASINKDGHLLNLGLLLLDYNY